MKRLALLLAALLTAALLPASGHPVIPAPASLSEQPGELRLSSGAAFSVTGAQDGGELSEYVASLPFALREAPKGGVLECPKVRWEKCPKCQARIRALGLKDDGEFNAEHYLQSYVMTRVEKFLADHGRRIIGWDEILEGELSPGATVMSWRGSEGGIKAAKMGRDVIMTPNSHFYFDYYQSRDVENEPLAIGGYIPVERVYEFDPSFEGQLTPEEASHILGVQANLWTEYIPTLSQVEYMLLPREAALAEVQWCQPGNRSWERFLGSLSHLTDIYRARGYNFAQNVFGVSATTENNTEKGFG